MKFPIVPSVLATEREMLWCPHSTYTVRAVGSFAAFVQHPAAGGHRTIGKTGRVLAVDPDSPPDWPRLLTFFEGALRVVNVASGAPEVVHAGPRTAPALRACWALRGGLVVWQTERAADPEGVVGAGGGSYGLPWHRIRAWDIRSGASWSIGETSSTLLALSPDGRWLATGGRASVARWPTSGGSGPDRETRLPAQPTALAALNDGAVFAGLIDGSVVAVRAGAIAEISPRSPEGAVRSLTVNSSGSVFCSRAPVPEPPLLLEAFATAPEERGVDDLAPAQATGPAPWVVGADKHNQLQVRGPVSWDFSLCPDGRALQLAVVSGHMAALAFGPGTSSGREPLSYSIEILDLRSGEARVVFLSPDPPTSLVWHPTLRWLAASRDRYSEETALVWDAVTGEAVFKARTGRAAYSAAFARDVPVLAMGELGSVRFLDATSGETLGSLPVGLAQADVLAVAADASFAVVGSRHATWIEGYSLRLWIEEGAQALVGSLVWSAEGVEFGSASIEVCDAIVIVHARDGRVHNFRRAAGTRSAIDEGESDVGLTAPRGSEGPQEASLGAANPLGVSPFRRDTDAEVALMRQLRVLVDATRDERGARARLAELLSGLGPPICKAELQPVCDGRPAWQVTLALADGIELVPLERAFGAGCEERVYDARGLQTWSFSPRQWEGHFAWRDLIVNSVRGACTTITLIGSRRSPGRQQDSRSASSGDASVSWGPPDPGALPLAAALTSALMPLDEWVVCNDVLWRRLAVAPAGGGVETCRVRRTYAGGRVATAGGVVVRDGALDVQLGPVSAAQRAIVVAQVARDLAPGGVRLRAAWADGFVERTFAPGQPGWSNIALPLPGGAEGQIAAQLSSAMPFAELTVFHVVLLVHAGRFPDDLPDTYRPRHDGECGSAVNPPSCAMLLDVDRGECIELPQGPARVNGLRARVELQGGVVWVAGEGDPTWVSPGVLRAHDGARAARDWMIIGERRYAVAVGDWQFGAVGSPPDAGGTTGPGSAYANPSSTLQSSDGTASDPLGTLMVAVPAPHAAFLRSVKNALWDLQGHPAPPDHALDLLHKHCRLTRLADELRVDVVVPDGRRLSVGLEIPLGAPPASWAEYLAALPMAAGWLGTLRSIPTGSEGVARYGQYTLTFRSAHDGWDLVVIRRATPRLEAGSEALLVFEVAGARVVHILAGGDTLDIGRGQSVGVQVLCPSVSRNHARLTRRDGRWYLRDLGSSSGTWLNDEQLRAEDPLRSGDRVQVGGVYGRFLVVPAGDSANPLSWDATRAEALRLFAEAEAEERERR